MKKDIKHNAWNAVANAPRKSYLGKYRRLTPAQNCWVRSLLNHWGGVYGGCQTKHLSNSGSGVWSMILTGWTGEQQAQIAKVLSELRKMGYSGDKLLILAKAIIFPKKSLSVLIDNLGDKEEADFINEIILKSFKKDNPIYEIGKDYYTYNKTITGMACWMRCHYAPFLTEKQCVDRVRWCIELFNSTIFFALKDKLCL